MLSGDNGLLKKAGQARDDTIIGEEREQVELAYVSAAVKKLGDNVTDRDLQGELDISVGTNKTKVTLNTNSTLNVLFKDTEHNYNVNNGKVAKLDDGNSGSDDTTTDLAKLQEYFSKGPNEFFNMSTNTYQNVENVDIDSSKLHDAYQGYFLITEYNNKLYKVDYSTFEVSPLETFESYEVEDGYVLIIPSMPGLVYELPETFSYITIDDIQNSENTKTGYIVDDGNIAYWFDESGNLLEFKGQVTGHLSLVTPDGFIHDNYEVNDVVVCQDRGEYQRTYDLSGTLLSEIIGNIGK